MGGDLELESLDGGGTGVHLRLPLALPSNDGGV
jgi:signal transduction histidine kinase